MTGQAASPPHPTGRGQRVQGRGITTAALCTALTLTLPAWAQKASPELTACIAANRQAATELLQDRDTEIRRHALHAVLVSRLQGLGGPFGQLRAAAQRAPRNLAECEKTTEALNAGREQLERIVGTPAQLTECSNANQAAHGRLQAALLELQAGGKVPALRLEAAAGRLDQLRPMLQREGLSLTDCRALSAELEAEQAAVQRLLPPAPAAPVAAAARPAASAPAVAPAACRQGHTRQYNELAQAYAAFVGAGPIPQELMAPLQSLSERLTRLSALIPDPSAPGWDCDEIHRALERARVDIGKLKR